jgi:hypothetical protein
MKKTKISDTFARATASAMGVDHQPGGNEAALAVTARRMIRAQKVP